LDADISARRSAGPVSDRDLRSRWSRPVKVHLDRQGYHLPGL